MGPEQLGPSGLVAVERVGLRCRHKPFRRLERAGLKAGLGCGQRALGCPRRVLREPGGSLEKGGRGGDAAARLRAAGASVELGRDLFVGTACRVGPVPGTALGIELRIADLGQRFVHAPSVVRRMPPVHRRTHQRMPEPDPVVDLQQTLSRRGCQCGRVDGKSLGRPPKERGVPDRVGRGQQDESLSGLGQRADSPHDTALPPVQGDPPPPAAHSLLLSPPHSCSGPAREAPADCRRSRR